MIDLIGFGVDLRWCVAKAGGNRVPELTQVEQEDLEKVDGHAFPWTLVLDRGELERFWPSAVLPNVDPLVATSIHFEFQIGEPSWAGFTYQDTFFSLGTLII